MDSAKQQISKGVVERKQCKLRLKLNATRMHGKCFVLWASRLEVYMQDIYIYLFMGVYYTMCVYIELFVYSVFHFSCDTELRLKYKVILNI